MLYFSLFNPLIIIKIDQMKFLKSLLFNFIFTLVFHESLISHEDILHYGNVKTVVPNPFTEGTNPAFPNQKGYVGGTNVYGDTGKYQRFEFYSSNYVIGAVVYFGLKEIDSSGTADTIKIVLRDMSDTPVNGTYGPGENILAYSTITLDEIDTTGMGNYILFDTSIQMSGDDFFADSFFIGVEWELTDHLDTFALFSDSTGAGLGDGSNRAWEKFNDESFNDFGCIINPTYCWDYDIDFWIGAVHTDDHTSTDSKVIYPNSLKYVSAYPNPFNPTTKILFQLNKNEKLEISIFNISGKKIRVLSDDYFISGTHTIDWNGKSNNFKDVTSGTYFVRIQSINSSITKKVILLK